MRVRTLALCVALALGACVSTGKKIDPADVQSFTVGKSTVADVEAKLGQPTEQKTTSDGFTTLIYFYAHSEMTGESFIPYAGAFVSGSNTQSQNATFIFDATGKLKSYTQSSGQKNTRSGLSNGAE